LTVLLNVSCNSLPDKPAVSDSSSTVKNDISAIDPGLNLSSPVPKVSINISPEYLGMSLTDVINIEGVANERAVYDGGKVIYLHYFSKGISFCFYKDMLTSVLYYSGIAGGYETGRFAYNTRLVAPPINNSLRFSDVIALIGQPAEQITFPYAPIPSFRASYTSLGLSFDFITSTQQMISMEVLSAK
jgi:hypothetical protein